MTPSGTVVDGTAVKEVASLAQQAQDGASRIVMVGDVAYSTTPLVDLRKSEPAPKALYVSTLQGLADYVNENLDDLKTEELFLHVATPRNVVLYSKIEEGYFKQRFFWIEAVAPDRLENPAINGGFRFGHYITQSDAVVALNALFEATPHRDTIIGLISRITASSEVTSNEHGKGQKVSLTKGISMDESIPIPSPALLAPFRTFAEIPQPWSPFIVRIRGDSHPFGVSIIEADGGAWQIQAIKSIKEWLRDALTLDIPIIG